MGLTAVFFDAGNTLLFPATEVTLAPLQARGIFPSPDQLYAAERVAKTSLDRALTAGGSVDAQYWDIYYAHLLKEIGCNDDRGLQAALVRLARNGANWQQVMPGTREILDRLRRKFRLGVISNSDGTIGAALQGAGLADCFASITDSRHVGHEKPDPRIFRAALDSLGVAGNESVYVGDIYSVDYLGAGAAGMSAILMDVAGVYDDTNLVRAGSLAQAETILLASNK